MINTNIEKQQQQTTGLNQRLNNIQLLSIGVIVSEKFCFRKGFFIVYKFALQGKQFSCQTGKGNRLKHCQFSQGVPVWRMWLVCTHFYNEEQKSVGIFFCSSNITSVDWHAIWGCHFLSTNRGLRTISQYDGEAIPCSTINFYCQRWC